MTLVRRLSSRGVDAVAMHGDKSQRQREQALARFERGEVMTLVATDVAARGIDVPDVARVINFDAPEDRETYVHRIGRTGRAGNTGTGISFVLAEQAADMRQIRVGLGLESEAHGPMPPRTDTPRSRSNGNSGGGKPRRRRNRGRRNKVAA